jgi:general secretion pathway protein A
MYLKYYSLQEKPFQITADPKYFWMGEKQKEALATIKYGITDKRGFLLLTGEVGTGKTVTINYLVSKLDINTVVAALPDPDLESMDFYNMLADGFDMEQTFDSKGAFLIHLREFLQKSYDDQKHLLLIIDESQRLNPRLMEDLRVLSNIELHDQKLINIFFVGQQEFNNILLTRQNRALAQRITARYHIEPLTIEETGHYIAHRLKIGGSEKKIFKPSAVKSVFDFSGGVPRLVNIICDHALLTGYSRNMRQLDAKVITDCANELRIPAEKISASAATLKMEGSSAGSVDAENEEVDQRAIEQSVAVAAETAADSSEQAPQAQPIGWRTAYAGVILTLVVLVAFAITQFTGGQTPRWDEDELTPQKYRTSLEKEKEILASRMSEGDETATAETGAGKPEQPSQQDRQTGVDTAEQKAQGVVDRKSDVLTNKDANAGSSEGQKLEKLTPLPLIKDKIVIQFRLNSNEIDDQSYTALDRIAAYLAQNGNERVFVKGYTDASGPPSYNETVSRFRANAVKSYIIGKGAKPQQIAVYGLGAANPIASNDTAQGRRRNRRVEIEFAQNKAPSDS